MCCCKIRRTGHQTRDAVPNRGDLDLALPSADLRHPTFIVVAARAAFVRVCVCALVGVLPRPAANGPIGRSLSTLFLPYSAVGVAHRTHHNDTTTVENCGSQCVCVWILCMHVRQICVRVCVCVCVCVREWGGCVGHLVFPRGRSAVAVHWI